MFFLRFSLPGPILALENNGFAKEILGTSLKIHELPRILAKCMIFLGKPRIVLGFPSPG